MDLLQPSLNPAIYGLSKPDALFASRFAAGAALLVLVLDVFAVPTVVVVVIHLAVCRGVLRRIRVIGLNLSH